MPSVGLKLSIPRSRFICSTDWASHPTPKTLYFQDTALYSSSQSAVHGPRPAPEIRGSLMPKLFLIVQDIICLFHCCGICTEGTEAMMSKTSGPLAQNKAEAPNSPGRHSQFKKWNRFSLRNIPWWRRKNHLGKSESWSAHYFNILNDKIGSMHENTSVTYWSNSNWGKYTGVIAWLMSWSWLLLYLKVTAH